MRPGGYFAVFVALLALTAVTILVANVDLGALNTPLALLIAAVPSGRASSTRLRPPAFARYRAASAAEISSSAIR